MVVRRRGRRAPGPRLGVILVVTAAVLLGYVPDHAVLEREPALARLARKRLFLGVRAHMPAQVFGRVETVQTERAQHLRDRTNGWPLVYVII